MPGFNFRLTLDPGQGFPGDGVGETPVLGETYPNITDTDGNSAGWDALPNMSNMGFSGLDRRLYGQNGVGLGDGFHEFRVDSGPGDFEIRLALGGATTGSHHRTTVQLLNADDSVIATILDGTQDNIFSGFYDATGVERGRAFWPDDNQPITITVTGAYFTVALFEGGGSPNRSAPMAHLEYTPLGPPPPVGEPAPSITPERILLLLTDAAVNTQLTVQNLSHDHEIDLVQRTLRFPQTVQDMTHAHQITNPQVALDTSLVVQNLTHGHTLEGVPLNVHIPTVALDMDHDHKINLIDLRAKYDPQTFTHAHQITQPTWRAKMDPNNMEHVHRLQNVPIIYQVEPIWAQPIPSVTFQEGQVGSLDLEQFIDPSSTRPITYTSIGTALPTGVTLVGSELRADGTQTAGTTTGHQIRATNTAGQADSNTFQLEVLAIEPPSAQGYGLAQAIGIGVGIPYTINS